MALVNQEPELFNMTIADNIRYGKPDASQVSLGFSFVVMYLPPCA